MNAVSMTRRRPAWRVAVVLAMFFISIIHGVAQSGPQAQVPGPPLPRQNPVPDGRSQPLGRCPDQLGSAASSSQKINVAIAFDARNGDLTIDDGNPIPVNQCFVDRFIAIRQVVTLKVFSKFRTDVTVTPTTYTVQ